MKTLLVILLSLHALAGAATAQMSGGNYTINLERLAAGGATTNQVMTFNGTRWVPADAAGGGVTRITGTANQITVTGTTTPTLSLPATITGLTSVTSTTFVGALTGTASGNATTGANTFIDLQTINRSGLGVTALPGLHVNNPTAATNGVQQYSPLLKISGQGYTTGGGSVTVNASMGVKTVQYTGTLPLGGGSANLGYFQISPDINGSISNVRAAYTGYNDLKLDLHGCLWLNPYIGDGLKIGGSPEAGTTYILLSTGSGLTMSKNQGLHWNNGFNALGSSDLALEFDASNTLALRNSTNPQIMRFYETDSGSNDEYLEISAAAGTNTIKPVATGSGVSSTVRYYTTATIWFGSGSGTPEAVETAGIGSLFTDTATGTVYRKTSGTGNTGWVTP